MKVIINNTEAAIYACGKLLIPGTNVLDDKEFDEGKEGRNYRGGMSQNSNPVKREVNRSNENKPKQ